MAVKKSAKKTTAAPPIAPAKARKARVKTEVVTITADQFIAGINKFTAGFESIARIEDMLARRDDVPAPTSVGDDLRIKEAAYASALACGTQTTANQGKPPSGPPPVEELIAMVNARASSVAGLASTLRRDVKKEGIPPEDGACVTASHGQLKDFLLGTLDSLIQIETELHTLGSYILR